MQISIVDTIPAEFPLVQYVAECYLQLQQQQDERTSPRSSSLSGSDVETRLFFKCVELEKWTLAHTLAEKMQRSMAIGLREQEGRDAGAHSFGDDRIRRRGSGVSDEQDVVLRFLDTCAS